MCCSGFWLGFGSLFDSEALWIGKNMCPVTHSGLTLCDPMDCSPPGSSIHGDSPGKNTGVGCYAFLQGIFPTQGLNPGLLHCRQIFFTIWATREAQEKAQSTFNPTRFGSSKMKCFIRSPLLKQWLRTGNWARSLLFVRPVFFLVATSVQS